MTLVQGGYTADIVYAEASSYDVLPHVGDPGLKFEIVFEGLEHPTNMALVEPDDLQYLLVQCTS